MKPYNYTKNMIEFNQFMLIRSSHIVKLIQSCKTFQQLDSIEFGKYIFQLYDQIVWFTSKNRPRWWKIRERISYDNHVEKQLSQFLNVTYHYIQNHKQRLSTSES